MITNKKESRCGYIPGILLNARNRNNITMGTIIVILPGSNMVILFSAPLWYKSGKKASNKKIRVQGSIDTEAVLHDLLGSLNFETEVPTSATL